LSAVWTQGDYSKLAERLAPVQQELVERLGAEPGTRWLDVATGTGGVALLAARAGAAVTGLDIAETMIEQARRKAAAAGLEIRLDVGDAQSLPYEDATFEVVSSCFGIIFPPDREAVAAGLARVCRPGGRLGLTTWRRLAAEAVFERFQETAPVDISVWGEETRVEELLGGAFELEIEERTWVLEGESPEELYDFMARAAPPVVAFLRRLAPERHEDFRAAYVDHLRGHVDEQGRVREPRRYLLVLGRRR
jgi:ubiquinone/menaquinone biosynthesis C-methylase UbiE